MTWVYGKKSLNLQIQKECVCVLSLTFMEAAGAKVIE